MENNNYPRVENAEEIIKEKCNKRFNELYKEDKDAQYRLDLELNTIIANGFESLYLIASDIVNYAHSLGYKVGFRGTAGNS